MAPDDDKIPAHPTLTGGTLVSHCRFLRLPLHQDADPGIKEVEDAKARLARLKE